MNRKRLLGAAALGLAALLSVPVPVGAVDRALHLDEAIRLALQNNERILSERAAHVGAEADLTSAKGAYDPLIEADALWEEVTRPVNSSFSGTNTGGFPTDRSFGGDLSIRQLLPTGGQLELRSRTGRVNTDATFVLLSPAYDTQLGIELRQPLLRNLGSDRARLAKHVAQSDLRRAEASLKTVVTETMAEVEDAYWDLVAARLNVGVLNEAVDLAQEQLRETRSRVESGAAPQTEPAQPQAELERRRGEWLAAQEALSRAENGLKVLILSETDSLWSVLLVPAEVVPPVVAPVDTAARAAEALSQRPEVRAAQSAVERRHAERSFAHSQTLPSLDAMVSYDRFGLAGTRTSTPTNTPGLEGDLGDAWSGLGNGDFNDTRIGVVIGYPLGNRAARGASSRAESNERQAMSDLVRVRKEIRAEVLDAAAALETTGQRIEAARAAREAAEVQLTSERDRYAVGLSTNFLVLTRQNDLSRARLDEISAQTDYRVASTEMARATGSLLEDHYIEWTQP
jgi:outer membrane protein TolC